MAIIGALMTAGIASFYGMGQGARMRGSITNIRTTLSLAKQRAIVTGQQLDVCFANVGTYPDQKSYYYVTNVVDHYQVGDRRFLPPGVVFDDTNTDSPISFLPDGGTGAAGTSDVVLRQTDGTTLRANITVYGLTGLSKVAYIP